MQPAILALVVILLCLVAPLAALSGSGRQAVVSTQTPMKWRLAALGSFGAVVVGVLALYLLA